MKNAAPAATPGLYHFLAIKKGARLCYTGRMKRAAKKTADVKTRYGTFRCVFEPERDMGGYTAEAAGLSGALSWGKTLADAKRHVVEAIEVAVEGDAVIAAHKAGYVALRKSPKVLA